MNTRHLCASLAKDDTGQRDNRMAHTAPWEAVFRRCAGIPIATGMPPPAWAAAAVARRAGWAEFAAAALACGAGGTTVLSSIKSTVPGRAAASSATGTMVAANRGGSSMSVALLRMPGSASGPRAVSPLVSILEPRGLRTALTLTTADGRSGNLIEKFLFRTKGKKGIVSQKKEKKLTKALSKFPPPPEQP